MIPKKTNYSLHLILKNLKYLHFLQKNQIQSSIVTQGSMDQFLKVTELRSSYNLTKMLYSSNKLTVLNRHKLQLSLSSKVHNVNSTKKTFFYYSPSFFQSIYPLVPLRAQSALPPKGGLEGVGQLIYSPKAGVRGAQRRGPIANNTAVVIQSKYRKKTKNKWFDWVAKKKDINALRSTSRLNQRKVSKEEFNKIFSIHNLNNLNSETVPLMKYSKLHEFKLVTISIASAEKIKEWAEKILPNGKIFGEVTNANTLHYKTFKPHKGGLFCERIFGPLKDFECACGIYSKPSEIESKKILEHQQIKRHFCSNCDVEYTWSVIRRYQLGYIQLVSAVSHVWYLKANPSYLSLLLDFKKSFLESIIYCTQSITLENLFRKSEIKNIDTSAKNLYSVWQKLIEEDRTFQMKNFLSQNKTNILFLNKKFLKLQTRLKIIQIYSLFPNQKLSGLGLGYKSIANPPNVHWGGPWAHQKNLDQKFRFSKVRQIFNESFSQKSMFYLVYKNFVLKYKFYYSYYLINNIRFICSTNQTTVDPNPLTLGSNAGYPLPPLTPLWGVRGTSERKGLWLSYPTVTRSLLPFAPSNPRSSPLTPQRGVRGRTTGGLGGNGGVQGVEVFYGQRALGENKALDPFLNIRKIFLKKLINFSFYVQKFKQQKQLTNQFTPLTFAPPLTPPMYIGGVMGRTTGGLGVRQSATLTPQRGVRVCDKNSLKFFYLKKNYSEILQIKEKFFFKKLTENKPNFDLLFIKNRFFIKQQSIWFEKNVVNICFFVFFTSILSKFHNLFALNSSNGSQINSLNPPLSLEGEGVQVHAPKGPQRLGWATALTLRALLTPRRGVRQSANKGGLAAQLEGSKIIRGAYSAVGVRDKRMPQINKIPILQMESYLKEILWTILMKQESLILLRFTQCWSNSRLQDSKTFFYSAVFLKSKIRPILKTPKDLFSLTGIKLNNKIQKINTMLTNSLVLLNSSIVHKKFIEKNMNFYKKFLNNSKINSLENIFIKIFKNSNQTSSITSKNSWFEQKSISGRKNFSSSKNSLIPPKRSSAYTYPYAWSAINALCLTRVAQPLPPVGGLGLGKALSASAHTVGELGVREGIRRGVGRKTGEKKKIFFLQKQTQIQFKKFHNQTNFQKKKLRNRSKDLSRSIIDIEKFLPKSFFFKNFLTVLHSISYPNPSERSSTLTPPIRNRRNRGGVAQGRSAYASANPLTFWLGGKAGKGIKFKNSLYTISYFYAWANNTNWKSFLYYNSRSPKIEDKNINYYKNRNFLAKTRSFQDKTITENFSKSANRPNKISSNLLPLISDPASPLLPLLALDKGSALPNPNPFIYGGKSAPANYGGLAVAQERKRNRKGDTRQIDQTKHLEIFTGASLIQKILTEFDSYELKKMIKQHQILIPILNRSIRKLKKSFQKKTDFIKIQKLLQKRDHIIKRLKFLSKISSQNTNPNSMILSILPVLPPDLRPILKLQNQIAASDLNRLYQRIIYRNERFKKFLKDPSLNSIFSIKGNMLHTKSIAAGGQLFELRYAQRLLQESVDNLIENGKGSVKPETNSRGQPLKSLSEILKGKQGRFRQYLLGKRVDYSGRSVIVVGPKLKLSECGLPLRIAIELFLPFLIKKILHYKLARTVIGAKNFINAPITGIPGGVSGAPETTNQKITWNLLNEIMKNHPILLNRAPTLHRLGIQAFIPKLIYGQAILLHPLVCSAFNADFDGDQMAVHVPITVEARTEAWSFLFSRNHLLSAATGEPIILPSQDMVLGCYYLTSENLTVDLKQIYSQNKAEKIANKLFNPSTFPYLPPNQKVRGLRSAHKGWAINQLLTPPMYIGGVMHVFSQKNLLTNNFLDSGVQSLNFKQVSTINRESKDDKKSKTYHIKRMCFSDWDSVLTAYQTNQIELQSILWLKWNGFLEQETNEPFLPIEIRIHSFGHIQKITSKVYLNSDSKGQVLSQYIRTTPGRVLLNTIIKNCIRF